MLDVERCSQGNTGGYNTDGASEKTLVEAKSQEPSADRGPEKTMGVKMSETGTSISPKRAGNVAIGTGEGARRAVKKAESWPESKKKVRYTITIHSNTKCT